MCIQILNVVKCCSIEPKYKREVSKIKNLCDKRPFNVTNVKFFLKKSICPQDLIFQNVLKIAPVSPSDREFLAGNYNITP